MADDPKTPVAIRITRPYVTEDEFLEREFDTLTRTSVILLGAQSRPQGVVLRFEIVLKGGESIVRGEGRVVGYKEKAYAGEPGLTLRFTRLDARSKQLVDRAGLLRDARVKASASLMSMPAVVVPVAVPVPTASAPEPPQAEPPEPASPSAADLDALLDASPPSPPAPPAIPSSRPSAPPSSRRGPPPLPEWAKSQPPPAASSASSVPAPPSSAAVLDSIDMEVESTQVDASFHDRVSQVQAATAMPIPPARPRSLSSPPPALPQRARSKAPPPLPAVRPAATPPSAPRAPAFAKPAEAPAAAGRAVDRPNDRDALLERLRTRAQSLPPERVKDILAGRAAH